jgi:hypothetical protein
MFAIQNKEKAIDHKAKYIWGAREAKFLSYWNLILYFWMAINTGLPMEHFTSNENGREV